MHRLNYVLLAGALLLTACGNPETSAQSAIEKAQKAWQGEAHDLDPVQRLKSENDIINAVEDVAKDYPKTTYGRAIAAGQSVGGVSITAMKQARDQLAPRAECYANPTVDCLRPFSSHPNGDSSGAGSQDGTLAEAQRLVCDKGFAAAADSLENFKINKPFYTHALIQVALAAADCHKPDEVKAAVQAYMAVLPPPGDDARIQAMMSMLATDALEPVWPMIMKELESTLQTPGFPRDKAASIAVALSVGYAKLGDAKTALQKYHYLTDTLGYNASSNAKETLRTELIIHGDVDDGLKLTDDPTRVVFSVVSLFKAVAIIGNRLKVLSESTALPQLPSVLDIRDIMKPVDAATRAQYTTALDAIEAALDNAARHATIRDNAIGLAGIDITYGGLALIRQKLGEPDKATADIKKGEAERVAMLGPNGGSSDDRSNFAEFQTMLALAQGDTDAAMNYLKSISLNNNYVKMILMELARKGDGAKALSLIGDVGQQGNNYYYLVNDLIANSQFDAAEKVIQAIPGNDAERAGYFRQIEDKMATDGDQSGAEAYAKQHGLIKSPRDRLHLLATLMQSKKIAGDRKRAEPILREMFTIGQDMDKAKSGSSSYYGQAESYTAEQAAIDAFSNGYTDLGIELYEAATNKDQRPLLHAFTDGMKPGDMTKIFMLAQDNLQGQRLQYVIDAGIRRLQKS